MARQWIQHTKRNNYSSSKIVQITVYQVSRGLENSFATHQMAILGEHDMLLNKEMFC